MTVVELAIFMGVFRANRAPDLEEVRKVVGGWFESAITREAAAARVANMVSCRWLAEDGDRFRATVEGREAARPLMAGVIRMIDQGTRLIDVALMMTVLRLCGGELDDEAGKR